METIDHQSNCACGFCAENRRQAALLAAKELPSARRSAAACSASLKWKQSGPEWQAEVHPEFQYVAMEIEGAWHAFLFLGSKYKRGHTIATDFDTADEAKQKCQDHYESILPQNS